MKFGLFYLSSAHAGDGPTISGWAMASCRSLETAQGSAQFQRESRGGRIFPRNCDRLVTCVHRNHANIAI